MPCAEGDLSCDSSQTLVPLLEAGRETQASVITINAIKGVCFLF